MTDFTLPPGVEVPEVEAYREPMGLSTKQIAGLARNDVWIEQSLADAAIAALCEVLNYTRNETSGVLDLLSECNEEVERWKKYNQQAVERGDFQSEKRREAEARVAELEAGISRVRNDVCYRWRRHRDDGEPFSESIIVEEFADLMTHPDAKEGTHHDGL